MFVMSIIGIEISIEPQNGVASNAQSSHAVGCRPAAGVNLKPPLHGNHSRVVIQAEYGDATSKNL